MAPASQPPPAPADWTVKAGPLTLRRGGPLFLIAGPCVLEDDKLPFLVARELRDLCASLGVPFLFKSSFDKANRTRAGSFRGPGAKEGLALLAEVRRQLGVPVLTDIHEIEHAEMAAGQVDVVQIPALLSRQTDLLLAAGRSGCAVNVKKGQFMAPWDIGWCIEKVRSTGNENVLVTERGVSFGYGALVADMRSIPEMQTFGKPVVFDATHSTQHMSGGPGGTSSGDREMAKVLARAAVAAGCDGVFAETHPEPEKALSDGPNMIRLGDMAGVLKGLVGIRKAIAGA
jgi:2-dehydro-3-deoxyphosphooctonate aldolase (KDO 8-P synthase)